MEKAHQSVPHYGRRGRVGGIAGIVDTIYSTHRFAYSLPCLKVPGRDTLVPDYHTNLIEGQTRAQVPSSKHIATG